jgi:hypothetical protein
MEFGAKWNERRRRERHRLLGGQQQQRTPVVVVSQVVVWQVRCNCAAAMGVGCRPHNGRRRELRTSTALAKEEIPPGLGIVKADTQD